MKKAIFKTGDTVEYIGERKRWAEVDGKLIPTLYAGLQVEIIETKPPSKGHGWVSVPDDEDGGFFDEDDDGYNVWVMTGGNRIIIWPKYAHEWKLIRSTSKKIAL